MALHQPLLYVLKLNNVYDSYMPEFNPTADIISLSHAREHFSALINRVLIDKQPVYLSRHGNRVVALISATELDSLLESANTRGSLDHHL